MNPKIDIQKCYINPKIDIQKCYINPKIDIQKRRKLKHCLFKYFLHSGPAEYVLYRPTIC